VHKKEINCSTSLLLNESSDRQSIPSLHWSNSFNIATRLQTSSDAVLAIRSMFLILKQKAITLSMLVLLRWQQLNTLRPTVEFIRQNNTLWRAIKLTTIDRLLRHRYANCKNIYRANQSMAVCYSFQAVATSKLCLANATPSWHLAARWCRLNQYSHWIGPIILRHRDSYSMF